MFASGRMEKTEKLKNIDALSCILEAHRNEAEKIVHCHGTFDLLHIGHIRHFEQAKKLGDILVVTVTPDRFVNKGSHRPVFNENLRAEAVAALGCVDYAAINKWPTAVEAIQLLRPYLYVKGTEYKDFDKDCTGGIALEEAAVKSIGGQLVFTDDITFSSTNLINRNLPVFSKEVENYLSAFSARYFLPDILRFLENARKLKVLVIGEAIIDEYQYCEAIGKSSKEPMLAVKHISTEKFAGGILAVANHLAGFCETVDVITMLGDTNPQEEFIRAKFHSNIEATFLYRKNSPTIIKRRFIERYFFTKLLELYEMNDEALDKADNERLCALLNQRLSKYDLIIVVDFGHGMLSDEAVDILSRQAPFLVVNAQANAGNRGYHTISRYPRADYICMAENEIRLEARDRHGGLKEMVLDVARNLSCEKVVVTRGSNGCLSYGKDQGFFEIPAFAGQVIDRMGAGDSFLSISALCVFQKAPMEIVGFIGNVVGAQAVAMVGNRKSIERAPLFKHIESLLK